MYYLIDDIKRVIDNFPPEYDPEYEESETVEQKIIPIWGISERGSARISASRPWRWAGWTRPQRVYFLLINASFLLLRYAQDSSWFQ